MALRTPFASDAKQYGFEWLRLMMETMLQEGCWDPPHFKVTQPASAGQRVDVAAGIAFVKGDSGAPQTGLSQGLFLVVNDASVTNLTVPASHGTNPRVDQIILRVTDSTDMGGGSDSATLEALQGTATAGATLDNRTGAAALPSDCLRLADVLVPAGSTSVVTANIRDRRPWARGARAHLQSFSPLTEANSTLSDIPGTSRRVELSVGPWEAVLSGEQRVDNAGASANGYLRYQMYVNGAQTHEERLVSSNPNGAGQTNITLRFAFPHASGYNSLPGSALIQPMWARGAGGDQSLDSVDFTVRQWPLTTADGNPNG